MTTNAAIVLLLQDEPLISGDLEMTLAVSGFDVTTIVTCREALHRFDTLRPDIAIVGIELRDGSTHAIVERLVENGGPFRCPFRRPSEHACGYALRSRSLGEQAGAAR